MEPRHLDRPPSPLAGDNLKGPSSTRSRLFHDEDWVAVGTSRIFLDLARAKRQSFRNVLIQRRYAAATNTSQKNSRHAGETAQQKSLVEPKHQIHKNPDTVVLLSAIYVDPFSYRDPGGPGDGTIRK